MRKLDLIVKACAGQIFHQKLHAGKATDPWYVPKWWALTEAQTKEKIMVVIRNDHLNLTATDFQSRYAQFHNYK